MINKVKSIINNKKIKKLNKLLTVFEDITITNDSIVIKFNKNIVCYSEGNQLFVSNKDIVIKSNCIHLNPNISSIDDVKNGETKKIINHVHEQKTKMSNVSDEIIKLDKEVVEEEKSHQCYTE